MSAAAVSQAVSSLESPSARRGLPGRLERFVRPDAGMTYLEACRKVLDAITDAEANVAADQLNHVGTLIISAPVLFGQRYVAPVGQRLRAALSRVGVQRRFSNRARRPCRPPLIDPVLARRATSLRRVSLSTRHEQAKLLEGWQPVLVARCQ